MGEIEETDQRINELALKLGELRRSLPAHSVKPEMLMAIEETEEELEVLREKRVRLMKQTTNPHEIDNR